MSTAKRYSKRVFPPYAHTPGKTPHPKKAGGHSEGEADPESYALTVQNWSGHEDYLFGIDLHNAGFYWEAHVWWEAVWKATPKGIERDFVQGLIKVAASALKKSMGQFDIAKDHALRGHELMSGGFDANKQNAFGIPRIWWENVVEKPENILEIELE